MTLYANRSRRRRSSGWGCLVMGGSAALLTLILLAAAVWIFRDALLGMGLQAAGFQAEGRTDQLLASGEESARAPAIANSRQPQQAVISAGELGQQPLGAASGAAVFVGADDQGTETVTVTTTEADIMRLCQQQSLLCSPQGLTRRGYTVSSARVDFKPGAAILYAQVQAQGFSQEAGLVMQLNATSNRLVARGVDIGGNLYSSPPGELAELVILAENAVNDVLRDLAVTADGTRYDLQQIILDSDSLTLVLQ